jgi:hypothetical protein
MEPEAPPRSVYDRGAQEYGVQVRTRPLNRGGVLVQDRLKVACRGICTLYYRGDCVYPAAGGTKPLRTYVCEADVC